MNDASRAIRANLGAFGAGRLLLLDVPLDPDLATELPDHVALGSEAPAAPPWTSLEEPVAAAIVVASRARRRLACLLQLAASRIVPGGSVTLVASNTGAGGSFAELAVLGAIERLEPKAHHRVGRVAVPSPPAFTIEDWRTQARIATPVGELTLVWYPGVFAEGHLDPASELLLEHLPAEAGSSLDIGTGCGVLLAALAMRSQVAAGSEIDHFAALATRETLHANGLDAEVAIGALPDVPETGFDLVVSNPPFHAGARTTTATANTLLRAGFETLSRDGVMLVVANRFLPYDRVLEPLGAVDVLAEDSRYRIWRAWRH